MKRYCVNVFLSSNMAYPIQFHKWIELSSGMVKYLISNWTTQSKNMNVLHPGLAP